MRWRGQLSDSVAIRSAMTSRSCVLVTEETELVRLWDSLQCSKLLGEIHLIRELTAAIGVAYAEAFRLIFGAAGLWLGVAMIELLQHLVEWKLGMFTRGDGIEPGFEAQMRAGFGYFKVVALFVCSYLVPRFLYQGGRWQHVFSSDKSLLRGIAVAIATLGLSALPSAVLSAIAVWADVMVSDLAWVWVQLLGLLLTIPLIAIFPWSVGLIAGDHSMTFRRSVQAMRRRWFWGFLLLSCCFVPAVVAHYLLNDLAYGMTLVVAGPILILDSLLVGLIGLLMGTAYWTIYRFRVLKNAG